MARRYGRRSLSKKRRFAILQRDKFTCQYCGRSAPEVVLEVDHVIPVLIGGSDDPSNLITACRDCNGSKSDKLDAVRNRWTSAQYEEMMAALTGEIRSLREAQRELAREYTDKFKEYVSLPPMPRCITVRPTVLFLSGVAISEFPSSDHGEILKRVLGCTESAVPGSPAHIATRFMSMDVALGPYLHIVKTRLTRPEQLELAELIVKRLREVAEREGKPWP